MQALLCREFGMKKPETEVDRMSFALIGLASVYLHGGRSIIEELAPHLLNGKNAKAEMVERLVGYAVALIEAECKRRAAATRSRK
jgi:hypothetical protein